MADPTASPDSYSDARGRETDMSEAALIAARTGDHELLAMASGHGANLDAVDSRRMSALMWCVFEGDERGVGLLLARGANPSQAGRDGWTPMLIAARDGRAGCMERLRSAGADMLARCQRDEQDAAMLAAEGGHELCLRMALAAGASVRASRSPDGRTALMAACEQGSATCARLLIGAGAPVDAVNANSSTALMLAAMRGEENCVRELIFARASLDLTNSLGLTAAMCAAASGSETTLRALAEAGASLKGKDALGRHISRMAATPTIALLLSELSLAQREERLLRRAVAPPMSGRALRLAASRPKRL